VRDGEPDSAFDLTDTNAPAPFDAINDQMAFSRDQANELKCLDLAAQRTNGRGVW
jgi:hypothetical protein